MIPVTLSDGTRANGHFLPTITGQRAYEAYAAAHVDALHLPAWRELIPAARAAWADVERKGVVVQCGRCRGER
jgi:hypothetical protein